MSKKYIITNILITSVFLICVIAMFISSVMWFNEINRKVDRVEIKNYVKEIANKEWFDYSYDIQENIDENGVVRYHITYYYSKVNETGTLEILVYEKDGKLTSEVI